MNGTLSAFATPGAVSSLEVTGQTPSPRRPRLGGIDFLRGLVMIIMVLDHTRDYLGTSALNPRDVHEPLLFLTRWITHFCAPVFVFLAGVAAHLHGARLASRGALSRYLWTRGLWLVVVEMTLVRVGWSFHPAPDFLFFQVIWAIGASMLALAALVYLPRAVIVAVGLGLVIGHHLLDGVSAAALGSAGWIWHFVHEPSLLHPSPSVNVLALYTLIPWFGVLALGYSVGPVLEREPEERQRFLFGAGLAVCCGFVLLRASNVYGDPAEWKVEPELLSTLLSFLNCEKYPPSLLYLAMTLGPALLLLAQLDARTSSGANRGTGLLARAERAVITIGRVPLFFYVSHLYLIHLVAVVASALTIGEAAWLFRGLPPMAKPPAFGVSLPVVYVFWALIVAALYLPSRWFAALKARRRDWWLSYL
jgi:uncharacterized membrane protein